MLLGRLRRPGVPPRGLRLVYRLARSPRLLLLELFASFKFRVALPRGGFVPSFGSPFCSVAM